MLGPELYFLGMPPRDPLRRHRHRPARSSAGWPADGESAFFSARRGDETICLVREDGSFPIRSHVLHEGIRFPLGVASAGLVILALLPDAEIDDYLERADLTTQHGPAHDAAALRERIGSTRATGYAVNRGLVVEGELGDGRRGVRRREPSGVGFEPDSGHRAALRPGAPARARHRAVPRGTRLTGALARH